MAVHNQGGRGKKNPYASKVVRIPEPLYPLVSEMVEKFLSDEPLLTQSESLPDKAQAIELARGVLRQKISASKSVTKLLQLIYNDTDIVL